MRLGIAAMLASALAMGCGAQVIDGRSHEPDAAPGDAAASDDADIDAPPLSIDGAVARCASRTVFLNFDGQALQKGPSDATLNRASWMNNNTGAAPPYLNGNGNRNGSRNNNGNRNGSSDRQRTSSARPSFSRNSGGDGGERW